LRLLHAPPLLALNPSAHVTTYAHVLGKLPWIFITYRNG
jgi:hypothetical protein